MAIILYVQPIFVPDEKRLERNINSIQSFSQYVKTNGTDGNNLSIILGGWARTDELWAKIVSVIKECFGQGYEPVRFDKNYGKAVVVNKLVDVAKGLQATKDFEYMMTADSDILFPLTTKYMFGRLMTMVKNVNNSKHKPFGLISLNQQGAGCHWQSCYENVITYSINVNNVENIEEKVVWPTSPSGIAGGCLFVSRLIWDVVKGYRILGVYSGDDAYLLLDVGLKGFSFQMADTISIVHPMEDDEEYAKWKHKVCHRDSHTGVKSDLTPIIKEADEFWGNRV